LTTVLNCSTVQAAKAVDPRLSFPVFPDPLGADGNNIPVREGDTVKVPLWYWLKITEYVVEIEKTKEMYEAWREVYLQEKR